MENKTITAIATPIGTAGVGIIRLSGKNSLEITKKIFKPFNINEKFTPRKMIFGRIQANEWTDDCLCVYFKAPNSFTGEDVVELQMHGGVYLLNQTLQVLLNAGATMAEPGEFSKRAVMNGKMDITQAEALIDMINAQSISEMKVASSQARGTLKKQLEAFQEKLTNLIASIEVALDHPEHEDVETEQQIFKNLPELINEIEDLSNSNSVGKIIKNGVNVALFGEPNVGKSSLLNAMLGYNRAIVTNIPGTTRDTICESYEYKGVRFNLIDTAGIRKSNDVVEQEGINRSIQSLNESDIVLYISDDAKKTIESAKKTAENIVFSASIPQNFVFVLNKIDLINDTPKQFDICISAKENININQLKELIFNKTVDKSTLSNQQIITNARQHEWLKKAVDNLKQAQELIGKTTLDCISVLIRQAWDMIGQITGTTSSEAIINTIFSKFCLGK